VSEAERHEVVDDGEEGDRGDRNGERIAHRGAAEDVHEFLELQRLHVVHYLLGHSRDEQQNAASKRVDSKYDGFYRCFAHDSSRLFF
jgi:hypothetical protein